MTFNPVSFLALCAFSVIAAPAWSGDPASAASTENVAIILSPDRSLTSTSPAIPDPPQPLPQNNAVTSVEQDGAAVSSPALPETLSLKAATTTDTLNHAPSATNPELTPDASPSKASLATATLNQTPAATNPVLSPDGSPTETNLWNRIRDGFVMPEEHSNLVVRQENWYASRPDYVQRMMERAQRYLFYIEEEVEKRGMPSEIALLPMIESAFNPDAYSVSHASGIWQFIPSTGKKFGMKQNWWYDGRRDIISATDGALDYLQSLHDQFGDWELALAAYNCGEGALARAIERNRRRGKPTDLASLNLPKQTRSYVPKLLAVKNIISDPEKYGLQLQPIPNQPYFTAVSTNSHIDAKLAARFAGISLEEFNALNPGHNRPVILQENADILLLPVDKVEEFRANLENHDEPLVSWQAYESRKGERLDRLAPRFGLSLAKLRSVNGLSPRAKVSNGQTLLVPLHGAEAENDFEAFNTNIVPKDQLATSHIVRRGETLGSIARHYHVSLASLKRQNGNSSMIHPGQRIAIAGGRVSRAKTHLASRSSTRSHRSIKQAHYTKPRSGHSVIAESALNKNTKDD